MNSHLFYNGSSLVVATAAALVGLELFRLGRKRLHAEGLRCRDALSTTTPRMLLGGAITALSYATGNLIYFPAFILLQSGNMPLADAYVRIVTVPSIIINLVTVFGFAITMHSILRRWFGEYWVTAVLSGTLAVWLAGSYATYYFSHYFR